MEKYIIPFNAALTLAHVSEDVGSEFIQPVVGDVCFNDIFDYSFPGRSRFARNHLPTHQLSWEMLVLMLKLRRVALVMPSRTLPANIIPAAFFTAPVVEPVELSAL